MTREKTTYTAAAWAAALTAIMTFTFPANAVVISISNFSHNGAATFYGTSSEGTVAFALTSGVFTGGTNKKSDGPCVTYTYTISGLDLGGDPNGDSVTGTITLTASGGTNPRIGINNVHWGVVTDANTDVWLMGTEKLLITAGPVTTTIDGGATHSGAFLGFTEMLFHVQTGLNTTTGENTSYWTIDGGATTTKAAYNENVSFTAAGFPSPLFQLDVGWEVIGDGDGATRWRFKNLDFSIDTGEYVGTIQGDTNGDRVVDAADYITVKKNMGRATSAGAADGDFDEDGTVEWDDLQTLIGGIKPGAAGETIPEPGSAAMLMLGGGWLLRRKVPSVVEGRRRRRVSG